jgi:tRNA threonylcarbamoyl adenosine modification protein YeaZ
MYILGIDSSTGRVSAAVNGDRQLLSKVEYGKDHKYMADIISLIDRVLKKADISLDFVDLFAVNIGPGDFTGTRIGVSVAKTLAWVGSKPVYGVESLDTAALGILFKNLKKIQKLLEEKKKITVVPILDVRRDEVYFSFYDIEECSTDTDFQSRKNYNNKDKYYDIKDKHPGFKVYEILNINIQNKNYSVNRISEGYLTESKNFTSKFSSLLIPDKDFFTYILLGGNGFSSYKHIESEVNKLNDKLNLKNAEINSGSRLGSSDGKDKYSGICVFPDKKLLLPDAFYLNLCAYYSYLRNKYQSQERIKNIEQSKQEPSDHNLEDYRLAPLYVKEFTPFKTLQ